MQFAPEVNKTDARNRLPQATASTPRSMQTASSKQISKTAAVAVTSVISATCVHDPGRFVLGYELNLAQNAERYQIDCAFCSLQLRSVKSAAAPNANLQLLSVDADLTHGEQAVQACGRACRKPPSMIGRLS